MRANMNITIPTTTLRLSSEMRLISLLATKEIAPSMKSKKPPIATKNHNCSVAVIIMPSLEFSVNELKHNSFHFNEDTFPAPPFRVNSVIFLWL